MPVRNIRTVRPVIWIPPIYSANWKLTVTRTDGTVDDISDEIISLEIEDGVTEGIGRFRFTVSNGSESHSGKWANMNVVKYYSDYASTATSQRFNGLIEKISYKDNMIEVTGRTDSLRLMDVTVTKNYTGQNTSVILKDLIDNYGGGLFTYNNVANSLVSLTVNWYQKPFWTCVQDLCTAASFDCYVDKDLDCHFFESGSRTNSNEGIVHDYNLLEVGDFANDIEQVKNRIIVYGAKTDGIQILYTAEDGASQTANSIREEIVTDSNITDYTQAQEYADYLLADKKDPPQVGDVKGMLLSSIQPGEKIRLSSPIDNLPPASYNIRSYKHIFSQSGWNTIVTIQKGVVKVVDVLKGLIELNNLKDDTSSNPYEMRFSYNFYYDTDTGSHSNTEIVDGVLKPTSSSGTWISPVKTTPTNVTNIYLKVVGETLTGATYQVSVNNGVTYQTITNGSTITATETGVSLLVKVIFSSADTQINALSLLYKTS